MKLRIVFAAMLLALPALPQAPRGSFNWWDGPLARELNLSDQQRIQIRNVIREFRPHMIDQRAGLQKAEFEMEEVFNSDSYDQRRANEATEKLVTARAELTRTASQMSLRLRFILTPQQWQECLKRRPLKQIN